MKVLVCSGWWVFPHRGKVFHGVHHRRWEVFRPGWPKPCGFPRNWSPPRCGGQKWRRFWEARHFPKCECLSPIDRWNWSRKSKHRQIPLTPAYDLRHKKRDKPEQKTQRKCRDFLAFGCVCRRLFFTVVVWWIMTLGMAHVSVLLNWWENCCYFFRLSGFHTHGSRLIHKRIGIVLVESFFLAPIF